MNKITSIKQLLAWPEFKKKLAELKEKNNLTDLQSKKISAIFKDILAGKIYKYDLLGEIKKQLKIQTNKALAVTSQLNFMYANLVPQNIKDVIEKPAVWRNDLIALGKVKAISLTSLNTDYEEGKAFLDKGKMPAWPDKVEISPEYFSEKEYEELLARNYTLDKDDFLPAEGILAERYNKINSLGLILKNKGISEPQAIDYARKLVKYVEDKQKYLLAQKVILRDILTELNLVKIVKNQVNSWQPLKEINQIEKLKNKIKPSDLSLIKKACFKMSNLFQAYKAKLLDKGVQFNKEQLSQYEDILKSHMDLLENDQLTTDSLRIIAGNLLTIMTAIESGALFAHQTK